MMVVHEAAHHPARRGRAVSPNPGSGIQKRTADRNPERLTNLFTAGKQPAATVSFKSVGPCNLEWADHTRGRPTAAR